MKKLFLVVVILCAASGWQCGSDGTVGPTTCPGSPGCPITPAPDPTVAGISPATGPTTGNTAITITGANFVAGATVTIAGVAATGVSVANATTLTARTGVRLDVGPSEVVVTNPDGKFGRLANAYDYRPVLVANPGSGYSVDAERDIDLTSAGSSAHPFPIAHFFWDCGQQGDVPGHHRVNCRPDTPSPRFRYRKEGFIRDGPRDYTVTLIIEDTRGNRSATASTTVRVRMVY